MQRVMLLTTIVVLFPSIGTLSEIVTEPWLADAMKQEPRIAEVITGWQKVEPVPEVGGSKASFDVACRSAAESYKAAIDPAVANLVAEKLAAAYSNKPPQWNMVVLALRAAEHMKADARVLTIAAAIVQDPPVTDLEAQADVKTHADDGLLKAAMFVLGSSGEKQYAQMLLNCLDEDYFRAARKKGLDPRFAGGAVVGALNKFPQVEARAYLVDALQRLPDSEEGNWIRKHIEVSLKNIDDSMSGAAFKGVPVP